MSKLTWEEIRAKPVGTILYDELDEGLRFIVMRGPGHLCAYIGIPLDHPLANKSYDDLPVEAHGGLTFAKKGDGFRPKELFWYGWDYGHYGDYAFYYDEEPLKGRFDHSDEKKWLVEDVIEDSWRTKYDFKKLLKFAEGIKNSQAIQTCEQVGKVEPKYPCEMCGKLRTKDEGGTTFTVCDECWDKTYKNPQTSYKPFPEQKVREVLEKLYSKGCTNGFHHTERDLDQALQQIMDLVR
jgi:hypothetical protein